MRPIIIAALCASLPVTVSAQTFRAESRQTVIPLSATEFEVLEDRTAGPRGYWCAAADFAKSRLGAAQGARLYIKSGRAQSRNAPQYKSVVFTTDQAGLSADPNRSYYVSLRKVGYNLPVGHAYEFCTDYREIYPFR